MWDGAVGGVYGGGGGAVLRFAPFFSRCFSGVPAAAERAAVFGSSPRFSRMYYFLFHPLFLGSFLPAAAVCFSSSLLVAACSKERQCISSRMASAVSRTLHALSTLLPS